MNDRTPTSRGLFEALVDDGRPLLKLTGLSLIFSGLFAFFLGATGRFLPHDIAHLGMTADRLRSIADSRLVYFMIHDRVSFGGTLIGVGTLYLWLAEFPLRERRAWAWWTFLLSGVIGFGSFLAYLGYGYLDTWHGVATLVLLPLFAVGMIKSAALVRPLPSIRVLLTSRAALGAGLPTPPKRPTEGLPPRERRPSVVAVSRSGDRHTAQSRFEAGRLLLLVTAGCLVLGGLIIMTVGMTTVFVPQDLDYMGLAAADLHEANPRLVPLIAHDRAGFGGGVCCCGVTMFFCVLCGGPSRSLWQALLVTGVAGFGSAIGVHFPIGYTSFTHLAPAYLGAIMFAAGMALTYKRMMHASP